MLFMLHSLINNIDDILLIFQPIPSLIYQLSHNMSVHGDAGSRIAIFQMELSGAWILRWLLPLAIIIQLWRFITKLRWYNDNPIHSMSLYLLTGVFRYNFSLVSYLIMFLLLIKRSRLFIEELRGLPLILQMPIKTIQLVLQQYSMGGTSILVLITINTSICFMWHWVLMK